MTVNMYTNKINLIYLSHVHNNEMCIVKQLGKEQGQKGG